MLLLIGLFGVVLLVTFMLGEQSGGEATKRRDYENKVAAVEAQLKQAKNERALGVTPYWVYILVIALLAFTFATSVRRCEDRGRSERRWEW